MTFKPKAIILASLLVFSGLMELKVSAKETDNKEGWVSPLTKIQFLKIPAGCFLMGSNNGFKFEAPAHKVCVDSFYLGKYEVTQKQWGILKKYDFMFISNYRSKKALGSESLMECSAASLTQTASAARARILTLRSTRKKTRRVKMGAVASTKAYSVAYVMWR